MKKSINDKEQCVQTDVMQSVLKASDLRIGNLILKNGKIYEITSLFFVDLHDGTIRENYNNNYVIEPIKLTEEWLNKLGLNVNKWFCENSYCVVEDKTDDTSYGWCMKVQNASHTKEIEFGYFKCVHELQNLYFALTGSELTVA